MDKDQIIGYCDSILGEKEMKYSHHQHNEQLWSHSGLILACWSVYDFWMSDTTFEQMFHELIWGTYCKWQAQAIFYNNVVDYDQYSLHEPQTLDMDKKNKENDARNITTLTMLHPEGQ